jgi:hypothetical protein
MRNPRKSAAESGGETVVFIRSWSRKVYTPVCLPWMM